MMRGIPPLASSDITQGLWEGQSQHTFDLIAAEAHVELNYGDSFVSGLAY